MCSRVCVICLVSETSTRLFSMHAAKQEDNQRYEILTGIKLKSVAYICQRCSIDLGNAINLRNKALESSKCIFAHVPNSKNLKPANAKILSSQIVDPPISSVDINALFKAKPNISVIKTNQPTKNLKSSENSIKPEIKNIDKPQIKPAQSKIPTSNIQDKQRISKRRNTVCISKLSASENADQLTAKTLTDEKVATKSNNCPFSKSVISAKKLENYKIPINAAESNQKNQSQSQYKKRSRVSDSLDDNSPDKKPKHLSDLNEEAIMPKNRQNSDIKEESGLLKYWIYSKSKGYHIETFKTSQDAEIYFNGLSNSTTYGLCDD